MKIVLAGATGFIGRQVVRQLFTDGHDPVVLTRNPSKSTDQTGIRFVEWHGTGDGEWITELEGANVIINLSGESLAEKRWTASQKRILQSSRIDTTKTLVDAVNRLVTKPTVWINASAVGYYGNVPEGEVFETHAGADDFLGQLCKLWEMEAMRVSESGVRVVCLRLGVVLGAKGGALEKMIPPFKLYIGGHLGSGAQWFPWVHEQDVVGVILHVIHNSSLSGPVNVTSPNPVRNKEFCRALGVALHRPSWLRVSSFALSIALGEFAQSLLTGQKAVPRRLVDSGYGFRFPELPSALKDIIERSQS